jgi:hypothetical protein
LRFSGVGCRYDFPSERTVRMREAETGELGGGSSARIMGRSYERE